MKDESWPQGNFLAGGRWRESPGRGEGLRVQEKGSSHQVQALVSELLTQKLGSHPPLGQPSHPREGWVLLLESAGEKRVVAMRLRCLGPKYRVPTLLLLFIQIAPHTGLHANALHV